MTAKIGPTPTILARSASDPVPAPTVEAISKAYPARASLPAVPSPHPPAPELLATIRTLGGILDDLERVRIMATNRVAAQERDYGTALPHLDVILAPIRAAEHEAELELVRAWRLHPLAPWAKSIKGVGEKSIARLISHTGDPGERPNPAKLWAYCGIGDPARKRRKGMTQEEAFALGNPGAKKQCWLIGEAFVKTTSGPYRAIYDEWRVKYAEKLHDGPCVRCGPAGKPAADGSPWSLKHQHEAAKRNTVKAFLKDMWIASRQSGRGTQRSAAGGREGSKPSVHTAGHP